MKGYLLDANTLHGWFSQDATIITHVEAKRESPFEISVITLGEAICGHMTTITTDAERRAQCEAWIASQFPEPLKVTKHTSVQYGEVKSTLAKTHLSKAKHPERWSDKITGEILQIDENDLWLAAQAIEHNLVLVTSDKMARIRTAAGAQLDVENWRKPIGSERVILGQANV